MNENERCHNVVIALPIFSLVRSQNKKISKNDQPTVSHVHYIDTDVMRSLLGAQSPLGCKKMGENCMPSQYPGHTGIRCL